MRVLWITGNFLPLTGGLEMYIDRLVCGLASYSEVGLLTDATQNPATDASVRRFTALHIARPATFSEFETASSSIAATAANYSPDVVHLASAGMAVYRACLPERATVIASVHGNDLTAPWQKTPLQDPTAAIVQGLNACTHIAAVSEHTAGLVRRWGVDTPLTVITSGCDLDFFRPLPGSSAATRRRYGIPADIPILLTVGRIVARKGHEIVLDAIGRLGRPVHWLIAGAGPWSERLQCSIERRGLKSSVSLLGRVPREDLPPLYNVCDLFVLTPEERHIGEAIDSEGFGLVFHEAMACGKAVVGSDVSGCREAIIRDATGLLVPPGDPQALADAITRLLAEPAQAEALGARGLAFVRASGGWERSARQVFELYEQTLSLPTCSVQPPDWKIPL